MNRDVLLIILNAKSGAIYGYLKFRYLYIRYLILKAHVLCVSAFDSHRVIEFIVLKKRALLSYFIIFRNDYVSG